MQEILVLIVSGSLLQRAFIKAGARHEHVKAVFYKSLASISFIVLGLLAYRADPKNLLVFIGLLLGGIGDFFMEARWLSKKIEIPSFLIGTLSFLLGHVAYIIALARQMTLPNTLQLSILTGLVGAGMLLYILFQIIQAQLALKIVGVIYICTIMVMFTSAIPVSPMFALGGLLFVISDTSLILYNFSQEYHEPKVRVLCLTTYYAAQVIIALSIIL